jgi:hypothetical protein
LRESYETQNKVVLAKCSLTESGAHVSAGFIGPKEVPDCSSNFLTKTALSNTNTSLVSGSHSFMQIHTPNLRVQHNMEMLPLVGKHAVFVCVCVCVCSLTTLSVTKTTFRRRYMKEWIRRKNFGTVLQGEKSF